MLWVLNSEISYTFSLHSSCDLNGLCRHAETIGTVLLSATHITLDFTAMADKTPERGIMKTLS